LQWSSTEGPNEWIKINYIWQSRQIVEQELITFWSPYVNPQFLVAWTLILCVCFVDRLSFFFRPLYLSVLLRWHKASDYPFRIFKLLSMKMINKISNQQLIRKVGENFRKKYFPIHKEQNKTIRPSQCRN
jgi:hypothetical protein